VGMFIEIYDRISSRIGLEGRVHREKFYILKSKGDRTFSVEQVTRIGIVQVSREGKPHFIHRIFAEYCVVGYVVNRLTEGNKT
jgi:hypothetical protein